MVEQNMVETAIKQYNITDAAIAKYRQDYLSLTVQGVDDKEGYDLCHAARMEVKGKRVEVEKTRKKLKEDVLEYGRVVDKEAKRITALLEPIEEHLTVQEKIIDDEKARIKAEAEAKEAARIQARIDSLFSFGCSFNGMNYVLPFAPTGYSVPSAIVKTCADEQFETICAEFQKLVDAENARIEKEKADKKAEEELLEKIRAEQKAEFGRLAAIADEQAKKEAKIKEEQEKIERDKQRLIDEEAARKKKIQDEKDKAEAEKKRKEELEKAKKAAAEKAVKDAEEKRIKEEKAKADKAEKERIAAEKKAARAPDKEKLFNYAFAFESIIDPSLKSKEAQEILSLFKISLTEIVETLRTKAEDL